MFYKMRQFTDDELIRRVWDQEEIRNVMGRFIYAEAANQRAEALEKYWVQQPENRATASLGRNWGFIVGMEQIERYYLDANRFGAPGTALMHPLSTKLATLAEDGKTAKGIWMGISYEMAPNGAGELDAKWINERVAVDFIREEDGWKIWHMFIGTNFVLSAGEDFVLQPIFTRPITREEGGPEWYVYGAGREKTIGDVALFDQIPDYPEREAFLRYAEPAEVYTALYNDQIAFPHLPENYGSFAETVSYGPDGFAACMGGGEGRVQ